MYTQIQITSHWSRDQTLKELNTFLKLSFLTAYTANRYGTQSKALAIFTMMLTYGPHGLGRERTCETVDTNEQNMVSRK